MPLYKVEVKEQRILTRTGYIQVVAKDGYEAMEKIDAELNSGDIRAGAQDDEDFDDEDWQYEVLGSEEETGPSWAGVVALLQEISLQEQQTDTEEEEN